MFQQKRGIVVGRVEVQAFWLSFSPTLKLSYSAEKSLKITKIDSK